MSASRGLISMDKVLELGQYGMLDRLVTQGGLSTDDVAVHLISVSMEQIDTAERTLRDEATAAVRWGEAIQNALAGDGYSAAAPGYSLPDVGYARAAAETRDHAFRQIRFALKSLGFEVVS